MEDLILSHMNGLMVRSYFGILVTSQEVQSNLDNSNADFSKLPDFSKTSDGPEIFLYCLL